MLITGSLSVVTRLARRVTGGTPHRLRGGKHDMIGGPTPRLVVNTRLVACEACALVGRTTDDDARVLRTRTYIYVYVYIRTYV